jgi:2-polyprenyl-3-methyl-5-hydroxy-6-metoxy-1,4-benzoquinol methylase
MMKQKLPNQNKDALWYDDYYRKNLTDVSPWNEFLIPELAGVLQPNHRLIELGCGQGHVLRYVAAAELLPQEQICGIDQSSVAVDFVRSQIPKGDFRVGDLHELNLQPESYDCCLLMETIEHLNEPLPVLRKINSLLAPGGVFYLSFPNFLHLPWLVVRILSEKLNKPNWIHLQPVDKIYTVFTVQRFLRETGFEFEKAIGTTYCLPMSWRLLRRLERPFVTRALNALGLWRFSFHPVMKFRKKASPLPQ